MQTFVNLICPTKTQAWIKRGALLVDVREKTEVEKLAFDVPHIVNIPLTEFEERFSSLPKDREMVLVCHDSTRSLRAAAFLIHKGYDAEKVVNMKHGIIRWVQKGFPVSGDTTEIDDMPGGCCSTHGHEHKHNHGSCCGS